MKIVSVEQMKAIERSGRISVSYEMMMKMQGLLMDLETCHIVKALSVCWSW